MKNFVKSLVSIVISLVLFCSVFCFTTSAAGTTISFSQNSCVIGDTVSVTVNLNPEEAMYGVGCVINYDASKFEYTEGNAVGGAGSLKIVESPSGDTKVSYTLKFKAIGSGASTFSAVDCSYSTLDQDKGLSGASASVTVNDAALSSNANLSALSLSSGTLSPKFSPSRTSYTVKVPNSVTEISVFATAADPASNVKVPAKTKLNHGDNAISVVVTSAGGTQKTYKITVNRSETEDIDEAPDETAPNVLEPVVDGVANTILSDISTIPLFAGFTVETVDFKGTPVQIAKDPDDNFLIYYLKAEGSEDSIPYTYDAETDLFTKLPYIIQGENYYIISKFPSNKSYTDNFYATAAKICGFDVDCLADNRKDMTDYYYLYCYANGQFGTYRFDTRENSIQRSPELVLMDPDVVEKLNAKPTLKERFMAMPVIARIFAVAFCVVLIAALVLIVLFIVRFFLSLGQDAADEDEFSSVTFDETASPGVDAEIDFSDNIKVNVVDNNQDED